MASSLHGVLWTQIPQHPVQRTAAILGCSTSQVYNFLREGRLRAVTFAGKTLPLTESIVELLAEAKPWTSNASRVARANEARVRPARNGGHRKSP